MHWYYTLYVALLFAAALLGVALALYALSHRQAIGVHSFMAMILAMGVWASSSGLSTLCATPELASFWDTQVRILGIAGAPIFMLIFALEYTGQRQWLRPQRLLPLFLIPAITILIS